MEGFVRRSKGPRLQQIFCILQALCVSSLFCQAKAMRGRQIQPMSPQSLPARFLGYYFVTRELVSRDMVSGECVRSIESQLVAKASRLERKSL